MQITSRFTIAIHTIICVAYYSDEYKVTSELIAKSTHTNPVIIRRILGQLKEAGLVEVKAGVGGAYITKPLSDITLLDIFNAVHAINDKFFNIHDNIESPCIVNTNIHPVINNHLTYIEQAMTQQMSQTSLQTILEESNLFKQKKTI